MAVKTEAPRGATATDRQQTGGPLVHDGRMARMPEFEAVRRWLDRCSFASGGSQLASHPRPKRQTPEPSGDGTDTVSAYLCTTQVRKSRPERDNKETLSWQGFPEDAPILRKPTSEAPTQTTIPRLQHTAERDSERIGGDGKRWRGKIGPSLFMSAVAMTGKRKGGRDHGEACGRDNRRVMAMDAERRALNDLPRPDPEMASLADPSDRLRLLVADSHLERLSYGRVRERRESLAWLQQAGILPTGVDGKGDPIGAVLQETIRQGGGRSGLARLLREARAVLPEGLGLYAKLAHPSDGHGFKGLPATGRRSIRDACSLLADRKGSLVFGTVTLPEAEADTVTREQLADFQSRWLFYARRMMMRRSLPPLVLVVAEIHPKRRSLSGAPIIHWHYTAVTSHGPFCRWAVSVADWHRVHRAAFRSAFGRNRGNNHGCRAEPGRSDPGRYLSKYLSKTASDCSELRGTEWERCVPKQWWAWTRELRTLVNACRFRPPSAFLGWCMRWRGHLEALGEVTTDLVTIADDGPAIGAWFGWASEQALDRALRQWIEDEMAVMDAAGAPWRGPPDTGPDPSGWLEADGEGEMVAA